MVSYIKTQWFRLLVSLICLVVCCIYTFQPAGPDTLEGLTQDLNNMFSAGMFFLSFLIWFYASIIEYYKLRLELLEKKQERDDAMYKLVQELVEANEIDRKLDAQRDQKIKKLEEKQR